MQSITNKFKAGDVVVTTYSGWSKTRAIILSIESRDIFLIEFLENCFDIQTKTLLYKAGSTTRYMGMYLAPGNIVLK